MKKLLSIIGAVTLIGTASTSLVACGDPEKPSPAPPDDIKTGLNLQVQKDFEFSNVVSGKTELLTELKYDDNNNKASWDVKQFKDLTLSKLLKDPSLKASIAKSKDSFEFLKNDLGLKASNQDYKLATFDIVDTNEVKVNIVKCDAKAASNDDKNDFFITGGTVTIQFTRYSTLLAEQYVLDLKAEDPTTKIVTDIISDVKNMSESDFNDIPEFHRGGTAVYGPKVGDDISKYLKTTTASAKKVHAIQTFINQGTLNMKVKSLKHTGTSGVWDRDDKMTLTIGFGEVTFDTEFSISIL